MKNSQHLLFYFLIAVALHSIAVGVALMLFPLEWLNWFGYHAREKFFPTQAGIFHLVMGAAYCGAALRMNASPDLLLFSVMAKFTATVFLLTYYFFVNDITIIFISGIGDLIMGSIILYLHLILKKRYASARR